jgi:Protein of unknown function DUF262/Protein of unknown function (DUF1524)
MPKQLRTAAMSIAELLAFNQRYVVPEFQRVYGWGETELERLFSDLGNTMRGARGDGAGWFFLGTIFLASPEGAAEAQIADGQQRILTATMVYAAARDLAEKREDADRLHAMLAAPTGAGFRFAPRDRDAAFFRTWVQERGATLHPCNIEEAVGDEGSSAALSESQVRIIRNRDAIVARLREIGPGGRAALLDFHQTSIVVAVITADTLEEARNAYASTQTRGLRQSETDKLKAELISDCPREEREHLAGLWEECEAKLGRDNFAELFQHLVTIEGQRRPQHSLEADLFRVFKLPRAAPSFIEKVLVPFAEAYRRICTAAEDKTRRHQKINGSLITMLRCSQGGWKAPALLAMRDFGEQRRALETFLADLERLASVLMVIGLDPYQLNDRYVAVIRDIKDKSLSGAALRLTAKEIGAAREHLQSARFALRDRFRMPVLLKLNDILAKEVRAIDARNVSCEHILPINPPRRGPWYDAFHTPEGRYNGGMFTHMLGNVTLLTHQQNRDAGNKPYKDKRGTLKRSGFELSRHAAKEKTWAAEVIARRTDELVALLATAWRLQPPE